MRNRVERFFRHLKGEDNSIPPQDEREKPHTGNKEPKTIPNLFTIYYQTIRIGGEQECLFGHYLHHFINCDVIDYDC
jgi:hypothetical protein